MAEDEQILICDEHSQVEDYASFDLISTTVLSMQEMLNKSRLNRQGVKSVKKHN